LSDYLKPIIVFLLLANVIDNLSGLRTMVWGLVLMAIPLAVQTLSNFSSGVFTADGGRVAGYAAGLTGNPNDLALMLNLILPLCVGLFLASRSGFPKLVLGSIFGLLVMAIVVTFSRAGFLTLAVSGLVYFWRLRNRPQRAWLPVGLVLALMALPLIPSDYMGRISTIVNIEQDTTHSAQTRMTDMLAALRLGGKHLLVGSGIGTSALAMNEERGETWMEIHNVYLQLLVELGLPGLLLFLLLFRWCLRATAKVLHERRPAGGEDLLFHIAEGVRVSLVAFAVGAFFHPVAYNFYFYYFAGLALAVAAVHARLADPAISGRASS
jgi:O-antigen ligase